MYNKRKDYYMVLDTETCTLPFISKYRERWNAKMLQTFAVTKPLIYDIGWVICDRKGNIVETKNFIVEEIFFTPEVFDTAYYKAKRPIYINKIKSGTIEVAPWHEVVDALCNDLQKVKMATAYNACFDFKKAIPFTNRYFKAYYSGTIDAFLEKQENEMYREYKNPTYLDPIFNFNGLTIPIFDLWGAAVERLLNNTKYKEMLLKSGQLTESVCYYKTSAESAIRYLFQDVDFTEEHTALSDAYIETYILSKVLKKGKIEPSIKAFPFRELGSPLEDCNEKRNLKKYRKEVWEQLYNRAFDGETVRDMTTFNKLIEYACAWEIKLERPEYIPIFDWYELVDKQRKYLIKRGRL